MGFIHPGVYAFSFGLIGVAINLTFNGRLAIGSDFGNRGGTPFFNPDVVLLYP